MNKQLSNDENLVLLVMGENKFKENELVKLTRPFMLEPTNAYKTIIGLQSKGLIKINKYLLQAA